MAIRIGGKGKAGGIVVGIAMFFGSFVLLWWNEGNAVKQFKTIADLEANTVVANADQLDPANEGKPVHLTAKADTEERLQDPIFDINQVALRLRRVAEMYQWEEDENKDSDSNKVTYSYDQIWSERRINSANFNDQAKKNPELMPYSSDSWTAENVTLGSAFRLPRFLIDDLDNFENVSTEAAAPGIPDLKRDGDGFYLGANSNDPQIGDMRIRFKAIPVGIVSLIAAQQGDSFKQWNSPETGRSIHKIMDGTHDKTAMIEQLETEARIMLWILRAVGFVMMFFGMMAVLSPLSRLAGMIPLLGNLLEAGFFIVALILSAILSLVTITIAWIFYRPLLGAALLVVIVGLCYLLYRAVAKGKQKHASIAPNEEPPPLPGEV